MVTINKLNIDELKKYASKIESMYSDESAFRVEANELLEFLKAGENDTFLMMSYSGASVYDLHNEIKYINLPQCFYTSVVILIGADLTLQDMLDTQKCLMETVTHFDKCMWVNDNNANDVQIHLLMNVFTDMFLKGDAINVMLEIIFDALNLSDEKNFIKSVLNAKKEISKNVLKINVQGTRNRFLLSMKKQSVEEKIFEYTGKRMVIKIVQENTV